MKFTIAILAAACVPILFSSCGTELREANANMTKQNESPTGENQVLIRDPRRKDVANVYWNPDYPLFCFRSDETITPDPEGTYDIWYSSNEDPRPYHHVFEEEALTGHLFYKFRDLENCKEWCDERADR